MTDQGDKRNLHFGSEDWLASELKQQAKLLERVLFAVTAILPLVIALSFNLFRLHPIRIVLTGWTLLISMAGLILLRQKRIGLAGQLMTYGYWLSLAVLVATSGGLHSPWVIGQLTLIVISGVLFSGTSAIGLALVTVLLDLELYRLQSAGVLPFPEGPPEFTDIFTAVFVSFVLVALLISLTRNLVQSYLLRARENERRYRSLFDETSDAVFQVDRNEIIISANQRTAELLGYEVGELVGRPYLYLVAPEEKGGSDENFERLLEENEPPLFERTMVRKDGSRVAVEFSASVLKDSEGEVLYYQGVARNVNERKVLEQQLKDSLAEMERVAMHDALTGMLNRRAITERAELEWHRAQREGRPISMMVVDVDHFKQINDEHGHFIGDEALRRLAAAILGAIRHGNRRGYDWAGRWGGDEFLVILPGASLPAAEEVAERLRTLVADTPIDLDGGELVEMKVSVGVACYSGRPGDELPLDRLLSQADQALYMAKEKGRNQVAVFRDPADSR